MQLLLAEDEVTIARALKVVLEKNKYTVDMVHNGTDALDYARTRHYDALILDIMMPGMDGISVLTTLRRDRITTPALFLTAKAEVEDRIRGLDAGADDYLPKPFDAGEFLARVRALTRRSTAFQPASALSFGDLTLDCSSYTLISGGSSVRMNNKEFQLMELFMRYPRQVFSTEHIMDRLWGVDASAELDVVWTYIGFLRRKMRELGSRCTIRTIRGAGYALEDGSC